MRCSNNKLSCVILLAVVLSLSLSATSCGGGSSTGNEDLVLVGFNVPNISGIPLNQPLIFTFSNEIDPSSITPDTLRVVGALGPNFEATVVDGNLVALLPRSPNFEDYSDAGLLPGINYTVSFAVFPAPETIRTPDGKPLLIAESFQFTTLPVPAFVEPRRAINHGTPPSAGGTSDDEGCLDNPENTLPNEKQNGSGIGARLLCLRNEGHPQVIMSESDPKHSDQSVGNPSAVTPGFVNLPALRVRINEPLDPITVAPYVPTDKFGLTVQLWLVGDTDRVPLPPRQIRTNKPLLVQSLSQTEIILVAANESVDGDPVGGVPQGTYMVNLTGGLQDLYELGLAVDGAPSPIVGGFQDCADAVEGSGDVPPGYRYYFVTLVVPGTDQSIVESFTSNLSEWGDALSGADEPGIFTYSDIVPPPLPPGSPDSDLNDDLLAQIPEANTPDPAFPEYTLVDTTNGCGQTTSANWNNGFRFLGLDGLAVNADVSNGLGELRAVFKPYLGDGQDGTFASLDDGTQFFFSTDGGASIDGDGIYEYESFHLRASDKILVTGSRPLVILCRGDCTIDGTIEMFGRDGGPGLDTDGTDKYENPVSIAAGGAGGASGPGGGSGGDGSDPIAGGGGGLGGTGGPLTTVFEVGTVDGGGGGYASPETAGGGGGGFATVGVDGSQSTGDPALNGGASAGDSLLTSRVADFEPDRTYSPNANGSGGTGGGGGGLNDNGNGTVENGDDGGGGGGGAGGGLYVIAGGTVSVSGSVLAAGGAGGNTYAQGDQIIDLGEDGAPGGTENDADSVTGIQPGALPSGAGGPGGGGSGGGIFLMGSEGVAIASTAVLDAQGGSGGESGNSDLNGGAGSAGVVLLGSMGGATIDVNVAATVTPAQGEIEYKPSVDTVSTGQSEWFDVFTPTGVFEVVRWQSNFSILAGAPYNLTQGTEFDVVLELQGADSLDPLPAEGAPLMAAGLTEWARVNLGVPGEERVEFPNALYPSGSPIDGKRFFRWRWRFILQDSYPYTTAPMPAIEIFTVEFER